MKKSLTFKCKEFCKTLRWHLYWQAIQPISSPAALILQSTLIINSEMFSYVNIFSGPLTPVTNVQELGNLLAWDASSWNYTQFPNSSFSVLIDMNLTAILGTSDQIYQLVIKSDQDFFSLVGLCNRLRPGVSRTKEPEIIIFIKTVSRDLDFMLLPKSIKIPYMIYRTD